jgi:tetratricopeptide (TPR) repeat protein
VALLKKLVADFPQQTQFRDSLALTYNNLGDLLHATNRDEEAETAFRDALAMQKQLAEAFPKQPDFRRVLALNHYNLAALLHKVKRPKDAAAALHEALAIQEQLTADFPKVPDYQNDLGNTLRNLAILHSSQREFARALSFIERARPYRQAALKASPTSVVFRQNHRDDLTAQADIYLGMSDHARLATTANELARFGFDPVNDTYDAACYLCHCVTLAGKDAQFAEVKRKELAQSYADRAVALLAQAVARGYKDAAHMKKDTDLDPLRAREDFKKLLADLDRKVKK